MCGCGGTCGGCRDWSATRRRSVAWTEQDVAAEILDSGSGPALERVIARTLARAAPGGLPEGLAAPLGGLLARIARHLVPMAGRPTGLSTADTSRGIAARAGRLLGIELEGLSAEDIELAAAVQITRLIEAAAALGGQVGRAGALPGPTAALVALLLAAQRHAPGLVPSLARAVERRRRPHRALSHRFPGPPRITRPAAALRRR